jgi:hypothetical protein
VTGNSQRAEILDARPGSETEDAIELSAVMPSIPQSFLYLLAIISMLDRRLFFVEAGLGREQRRTWF